MGWHLDGRVTAVLGTHTHVQTADERILPKGTACLTDAGMTGPHDSIIGVSIDAALGRFLSGLPAKFEPAAGAGRLNAVIITADQATGRATAIERLNLSAAEVDALAAGATTQAEREHDQAWRICFRFRSRTKTRSARPPRAPRVPERRVCTVAELTAAIRRMLETGIGDVWVEGELSNCRVWNTGHVYFTLKDEPRR